MRVLFLDIGDVRCGLAISDPTQKVATPLCVLSAAEVMEFAPSFRRVLEDWEIGALVCGLPKTLAGEEGPYAARVRKTANALAERCGYSCEFFDERYSSAEASRILKEQGYSAREMRGKLDMIAASLCLQAWLDARNSANAKGGAATDN